MTTTIYKKDTKGNIRFLKIETRGDELLQTSGMIGTENPITHSKNCKGKNIGRSNETSAEEQCEKEAEALKVEKLKEGYFLTEQEADTIDVLFPMLAKDFNKEVKKVVGLLQ